MAILSNVLKFIWKVFSTLLVFILNVIGYFLLLIKNIVILFLRILGFDVNNPKREIKRIDKLTGLDFEKYMVKVLKKNKYKKIILLPPSNDYGVDIIAEKKRVRYGFQCKLYSGNVGNSAVQEIVAGMAYHNLDVGIVVTNSYYTKNAINLAKSNNIELWDRDYLLKII